MGDWLQDRCNSIQKAQQEHVQKAFEPEIEKARSGIYKPTKQNLEKGKSFPIGTIHNGFKKVSEGKWQKVSEHGMTKKEHNVKTSELAVVHGSKAWKKHTKAADSLDDKDYSDEDVLNKK
jgi:hypothetical protein